MKLRKFNEGYNEKEIIEIIREEFYLITDKYPLDIKLDIFNGYGYNFTISLKFKSTFLNIGLKEEKDFNVIYKNINQYNSLIKDCDIIINNLKSHFELSSIKTSLGNYTGNSITITLISLEDMNPF